MHPINIDMINLRNLVNLFRMRNHKIQINNYVYSVFVEISMGLNIFSSCCGHVLHLLFYVSIVYMKYLKLYDIIQIKLHVLLAALIVSCIFSP